MGAVNLALPITMIFTMVHMLFGTGGEILVAAAKGARDNEKADRIFSLSMLIMISIALLLSAGGILSKNFIALMLSRGNSEWDPWWKPMLITCFYALR